MSSVDPAPSTQVIIHPRSQTASDLVFVNSSGPKDHEEARRLIRANAMRDYWRRKKDQEVKYGKGILIDEGTTAERDEIPEDDLVHDRSSNPAWQVSEMPHSSGARKRPNLKPRDNRLPELAVAKAGQCIFFDGDNAGIVYEQRGKDAGRGPGSTHAWPRPDQISDPSRSPGLGLIDPFNMLPVGGSSEYNSFVLSHCKSPLSRSFSLSGLVRTHQGHKR
ncbi:MAG: hypothetical protein Q9195_007926 [Heterodermia aff. obscurata]